jgi:GGDEF domain-containing protein
VYGFVAGEEVLRFTAMVLGKAVDSAGTPNDFIGHVGSDDFIIITDRELIAPIVEDLQQRFNADVGTHYDWSARERGYLLVRDEAGSERKVDLMTLSVGVVTADDGPFADIREITEKAASTRR